VIKKQPNWAFIHQDIGHKLPKIYGNPWTENNCCKHEW